MFDESRRQSLSQPASTSEPPKAFYDFKSLPPEMLIQCMDEIKRLLPPLTLAEMNMEEELLLQFHSVRDVQNRVLNDDVTPVNQQAQIANTVGATLAKLGSLQMEIYTSERFKRIENLLIRALRKLPETTAEEFLVEYEAVLRVLR